MLHLKCIAWSIDVFRVSLSIYRGGVVLNEKKVKLSLTGAIVILSICILFSAFTISSAIRDSTISNTDSGTYDYELNRFNENFEELIKILQENKEVSQ